MAMALAEQVVIVRGGPAIDVKRQAIDASDLENQQVPDLSLRARENNY